MRCPVCEGRRTRTVLACPGARLLQVGCDACHATGVVDDQYLTWHAQGKQCKTMRMDPYMDMRAVAEAMGITPTEVSRMERGLDDPAPLLAWHMAERRVSHA